ncbi:MAG: hypothetical protein K5919_02255 [Clostridiales bacterium]|nr:hypothetical protein [Clostridiales bacterium]
MGFFSPIWMTENYGKKEKAIDAVKKITDQEKLSQIVQEAPFEDVRVAAIQQMNDDQQLTQIAIAPPPAVRTTYFSVPKAAARKVRDEKLLCKIAISADYNGASETAVDRINDPDLLEQVARNGINFTAKRAAEKITDMARIERILMTSDNGAIPPLALSVFINRIKDNELLKKLARSAASSQVRRAAASCVIDTDILLDTLLKEDNFWERSDLILKLSKSMKEEPVTEEQRQGLIRALIREDADNVKFEFLWRDIVDAPALREICKHARKPEYRGRALEELCNDEEAIKENEIKPLYKEIISDPDSGFNPNMPSVHDWNESIHRVLQRIKKNPELLLDFVQDDEMDCVMAECCVSALFGLKSADCENIADLQDKAVAAYLEHIPQYLEKAKRPDINEGYYLRELGCALPDGRRQEYGFDYFSEDMSGLKFKGKTYSFT